MPQAFAGTWKYKADGYLILKQDGSFVMTFMPGQILLSPDDSNSSKLIMGTGKWIIEEWKFQFPKITIVFETCNLRIGSAQLYVSGSGFWETSPPYNELFTWVGEEGGQRYELIKQ